MSTDKLRRRWPKRLLCPIHKCPMKVRCVIDQQQYRYCPVTGCPQSLRTIRTKLPRRRAVKPEPADAVPELRPEVTIHANPMHQREAEDQHRVEEMSVPLHPFVFFLLLANGLIPTDG